ncbi:MAG: ATP-binding protein [Mariprofundaceae bacterium]|nr:ATP-binding protein [Mariprofundaceae bacterium]
MNTEIYLSQCKRSILMIMISYVLILAAGYTWVTYNQLRDYDQQYFQDEILDAHHAEHHELTWQHYQAQWLLMIGISMLLVLIVGIFLYRQMNKTQRCMQAEHASLIDIADQRAAALEKTNEELHAFAYSVSHDLRGPLRSLDGFALALYEDYHEQLDAEGKDFVSRIRKASQRMAKLIDAMLVLSRVSQAELHISTIHLSNMAEKVVRDLKAQYPEREVDIYIQDNMTTLGDPHLMQQVVENLLNNAWKFTQHVEKPEISFTSRLEHGQSVYHIEDNGVGFDEAYQAKLFIPFQRLHQQQEFEGTGVGLPIVQRIIHRHGGIISAESAIDKGAIFSFNIPQGVLPL